MKKEKHPGMSHNILIAYYSHSGNTERVARCIAEITGGDLYPLQPAEAYPATYQKVLKQARNEIRSGYLPPLKECPYDLSKYDTVFLGTPNWCGGIAPPVASFLAFPGLRGKTIAPFVTHGGGADQPFQSIRSRGSGLRLLPGFSVYAAGDSRLTDRLKAWISGINAAA